MTFDPRSVEVTCDSTQGSLWLSPMKNIKVCGYSDLFFQKTWTKGHLTPRWPLTPSLLRSHAWLYPRITVSKSHENTSKYVDTVTLFFQNLNQRSLTPRWPLNPHLLRSHMWLYPRIIVSKSHGNTSMYVDTVINLAKYHIHTYTYIHTTYYIQNELSHSLGETSEHSSGKTKNDKRMQIIWVLKLVTTECEGVSLYLVAGVWNISSLIPLFW